MTQLVRQWLLLSMIPKAPPRIDAGTLAERLRDRGVRVHRRTIQRDLVELAKVFPLVADAREKPYGWRWADGAEFLCSIPILRDPEGERISVAVTLRAEPRIARVVIEGLRGRDGDAREVSSRRCADGSVEITARVVDGCSLRRWLLGFGGDIEVLAPAPLRMDFAAKAARIAARYPRYPRYP